MEKVSKISDIWPAFQVKDSEIEEAIEYATISLPWTFDRLRYGPRTQKAVNNRLLHVLIGVLNQTILERALTEKGYTCSKEWKKYRDSDVFDFTIQGRTHDVKTFHVYSEYNDSLNRKPFSVKLLVSNKDNEGPEWRTFFPMMVTLSQLTVEKMKDSYIFGVTETYEDIRKRQPRLSDKGFWCAAPYDKAHSFFHSTRVIKLREKEGQGFKVRAALRRTQRRLFENKRRIVKLRLIGEWAENRQIEEMDLREGKTIVSQKEFSSLSCVKLEHPATLGEGDEIVITVQSIFREFVPKPTNPRFNLNDANFAWIMNKQSFVNLRMPEDYKVYWIGHIPFKEFASLFTSYRSYFIPLGNNMDSNQPGRVNADSREKLESLDRRRQKAVDQGIEVPWPPFLSLIDKKNVVKAGLLIAAMSGARPIGAACYYYPPYALWESAIYVLPRDLYTMDSLPKT
jgi:hypothetical protein